PTGSRLNVLDRSGGARPKRGIGTHSPTHFSFLELGEGGEKKPADSIEPPGSSSFTLLSVRERAHDSGADRTTSTCRSESCSLDTKVGASLMRSTALWVLGKAMTSRKLSRPASNIASRSSPRAIPPWGGAPYLSPSNKKPNFC